MPQSIITINIPSVDEDGQVTMTTLKNGNDLFRNAGFDHILSDTYSHIVQTFGQPTNNGSGVVTHRVWIIDTPDGLVGLYHKQGHTEDVSVRRNVENATTWGMCASNDDALEWVYLALRQ